MLAAVRILAIFLIALIGTPIAVIYMLFKPRDPMHTYTFAQIFARSSRLLGIKLLVRIPEGTDQIGEAVYIGNHQNNFDMFTMTGAVQPGTVSVGKKSLLWLPLFGIIYYLSGNILIDRNNRSRSADTIAEVARQIRKGHLSVMMFPEGTRSRGRGLLPFKTGAFHTALQAEVPLVPVVCSDTHNVDLNRWDNGVVIVEVLEPISIEGKSRKDVRRMSKDSHEVMLAKFEALNAEVASGEALQDYHKKNKTA